MFRSYVAVRFVTDMEMATVMAATSTFKWIFVVLVICVTRLSAVHSTNTSINDLPEARLIQALNFNGRVAVRPATVYSKPVNVTLSFYLSYVKDLNIPKQEFSVVGIFIMSWNDPFLTWNPADYDNITVTNIPAASLWVPQFMISNSLDAREGDKEWRKEEVSVHSDGTVAWFPSGVFDTVCKVNVFSYPFDSQECSLNVFQYQSTEQTYVITGLKNPETLGRTENSDWQITNEEVTTLLSQISSADVKISQVVFSYTLKRQPTSPVLTVILPVIYLFLIGIMVFPLPADSGEKLSLSVASLLSFFMTQIMISEQIPKSWTSIPVIMIFNMVFMLLNVLSVCGTVVVLNLHHKQSVTEVPKWIERIFESRWRRKNAVHDGIMEVEPVSSSEADFGQITSNNGDNSIKSTLSSLLNEIQIAKAELKIQNENEELTKRKWRDIADAVNSILCGVYLFVAIVMGLVCSGMWVQS